MSLKRLIKPALAELSNYAILPSAPMVACYWYDASFSPSEVIKGVIPLDYKAGCPDVVIGFFLGVHDGCVVLSNSAYVRTGTDDSHRHIWNIPIGMVIKLDRLRTED